MKKRGAFTLVELILAVFIFAYMSTSLATIYSTANRHMFQNYRRNIIKSNVVLSMRAIHNTLGVATRIDLPAHGAQGDLLFFATNVDQLTGCYPVNSAAPAAATAWHYFCLGPDPDATIPAATEQCLYYHTAPIAGGTACGSAAPGAPWSATVPVAACGTAAAGQTVTLLMRHVPPYSAADRPRLFSRLASTPDFALGGGTVRVKLRSFWVAGNRGFGGSQRDVDFSLNSLVTAQVSRP